MIFYWQIAATTQYLDQVSRLPINIQESIGKRWIEVATNVNPMNIGNTSTRGQEPNPNVVVMFPGLTFEFVYRINKTTETILLINCEELHFLNHGQTNSTLDDS